MNNKGFMMAEVIVVSAIIMISLTGIYLSYNKIISAYNTRIDYYDIPTLYELAYIRDSFNETGIDYDYYIQPSVGYTKINVTGATVYYFLVERLGTVSGINETFQDYINFISTSVTFDSDKVLVMEKCTDADHCKYTYLEVKPKNETS